jgi:hypothetical protein
VGFLVDKVALGQVFSEYFGFSCQLSFHRLLHSHHHLSSGAGTIGQLVADVPSGLSLTPPQETKKKKTKQARPAVFRILSNSSVEIIVLFAAVGSTAESSQRKLNSFMFANRVSINLL